MITDLPRISTWTWKQKITIDNRLQTEGDEAQEKGLLTHDNLRHDFGLQYKDKDSRQRGKDSGKNKDTNYYQERFRLARQEDQKKNPNKKPSHLNLKPKLNLTLGLLIILSLLPRATSRCITLPDNMINEKGRTAKVKFSTVDCSIQKISIPLSSQETNAGLLPLKFKVYEYGTKPGEEPTTKTLDKTTTKYVEENTPLPANPVIDKPEEEIVNNSEQVDNPELDNGADNISNGNVQDSDPQSNEASVTKTTTKSSLDEEDGKLLPQLDPNKDPNTEDIDIPGEVVINKPESEIEDTNDPGEENIIKPEPEIEDIKDPGDESINMPEPETEDTNEPDEESINKPEPEIEEIKETGDESINKPEPEINDINEPGEELINNPEPEIEDINEPGEANMNKPEPDNENINETGEEIINNPEPEMEDINEPGDESINKPEPEIEDINGPGEAIMNKPEPEIDNPNGIGGEMLNKPELEIEDIYETGEESIDEPEPENEETNEPGEEIINRPEPETDNIDKPGEESIDQSGPEIENINDPGEQIINKPEPGIDNINKPGEELINKPETDIEDIADPGEEIINNPEPENEDITEEGEESIHKPEPEMEDINDAEEETINKPEPEIEEPNETGEESINNPEPEIEEINEPGEESINKPEPGIEDINKPGEVVTNRPEEEYKPGDVEVQEPEHVEILITKTTGEQTLGEENINKDSSTVGKLLTTKVHSTGGNEALLDPDASLVIDASEVVVDNTDGNILTVTTKTTKIDASTKDSIAIENPIAQNNTEEINAIDFKPEETVINPPKEVDGEEKVTNMSKQTTNNDKQSKGKTPLLTKITGDKTTVPINSYNGDVALEQFSTQKFNNKNESTMTNNENQTTQNTEATVTKYHTIDEITKEKISAMDNNEKQTTEDTSKDAFLTNVATTQNILLNISEIQANGTKQKTETTQLFVIEKHITLDEETSIKPQKENETLKVALTTISNENFTDAKTSSVHSVHQTIENQAPTKDNSKDVILTKPAIKPAKDKMTVAVNVPTVTTRKTLNTNDYYLNSNAAVDLSKSQSILSDTALSQNGNETTNKKSTQEGPNNEYMSTKDEKITREIYSSKPTEMTASEELNGQKRTTSQILPSQLNDNPTTYVLVEETETPIGNKISNETITTYSSSEIGIEIYGPTGINSSPTIGNNHINLTISSTQDIKTEKMENDLSLGNNNEDKQSTTPNYGEDILEKKTKVTKTSTIKIQDNELSPNTFGNENAIKNIITTQSEIKVLTEKQNTTPKDENIITQKEQSTREVTSIHNSKDIGSNANKQTGLWKDTALEERSSQPDYDYITSSYKTEEEKPTAFKEKTATAKPSVFNPIVNTKDINHNTKPSEKVIENLIETQSVGSQETSLKQTSNIADDSYNFSKLNIVSSIKGPNPKNQTFTESIKTSVEEAIMTKVPDIDNDLKPTKYEVNSFKDVNNGNTLPKNDNSDTLTEKNKYSLTTNNDPDTKTDTIQDISITTIEEEQVTKKDVTEHKSKTTEYITSQQASQDLSVSPGNTEVPATRKGEWNSNAYFYTEPTKNQVTTKAAKLFSTRNPEFDNNLASESSVSKTFDITTHQWNHGIDKEQTETNDYSNEQNRDATSLSSKITELSETLSTTTLKTKDYSNEQNQDATSLTTKNTELSETLRNTTLKIKDYSNEQNQDATSLSTKSTELSETLTTTNLKTKDYSNEQNQDATSLLTKSTELSETLTTTTLKTKDYSNEQNQDATSLSTKSTELNETLTTTTLKPKDYSNEQNQDATSLSTKSTELSETLTTTTLKPKEYSNEQNQDATGLSTNSTELSETLNTKTLKPKEYSNKLNLDATSLLAKTTEISETLTTTTMEPKDYSNEKNQDATSLLTNITELSETLTTTNLKSIQSEKQVSTEKSNKITSKGKITEIGKTTSGGENFKTQAIDNDAKPSVSDQTPPQTTTCVCPTTSTSSSSTTQATTPGILTTSGFCICPDTNDSSKEEETATNMPETKGRRRRRKEFEEMDLYVDNFDQKIMKKMPFLKFY